MKIALIGFGDRSCKNMKLCYQLICDNRDRFALMDDALDIECLNGKDNRFKDGMGMLFEEKDVLIFFGAVGIAVRFIAPHIKHKSIDPAVIVIDDGGNYCIPVLSGHLGGANEYAGILAELLEAQAIITTATDIAGCFSPDMFAKENGLIFDDYNSAKLFAVAALNDEQIVILDERSDKSGKKLKTTVNFNSEKNAFENSTEEYGICIVDTIETKASGRFKNLLKMYEKDLILGVGCKRLTDKNTISRIVNKCLQQNKLNIDRVYKLASIDLKADEKGMIDYANGLGIPMLFYTKEELIAVEDRIKNAGYYSESEFVKGITGVGCVCEASVFAAGGTKLLVSKYAEDGVTVAVGRRR